MNLIDPQERLKLDNQLCFTLYATSREITKLYRPLLDELNLTYPQYLVMLALWEKEGVTVNELGEKLFLDSGTLTPLLKRMESLGYLVRERSKEDERRVIITLTPHGRDLREDACLIPEQLVKQTDYGGDLNQLLLDMRQLLRHIHQHNQKMGK